MKLTKSFAQLALVLLLVIGGVSATGQPAAASSGGVFELSWYTVDGGGGNLSGGDFAISSTIGQADHALNLTGGAYEVDNGFWAGIDNLWSLFLPYVTR